MTAMIVHHFVLAGGAAGCFPNCQPANGSVNAGGSSGGNAALGFAVILIILRVWLGAKGKGSGGK